MNSKKIFGIVLSVSSSFLISGVAFAADTGKAPVNYTQEQQTCINNKQASLIRPAQENFNAAAPEALKKEQAAIRAATDILNAAAPDALKVKTDAIKAATDSLNAATPNAVKKELDAIKAAQQIKDETAKGNAIKAAIDEYNNDPAVQKAKIPYMAAIKAASDEFNNNPAVQKAKIPYTAAVKAASDEFNNDAKVQQARTPYTEAFKTARDQAIKECTSSESFGSASLLQIIKDLFKRSTSSLMDAFKFKK
ncbi:MAG: hypothetical protein NTY04_03680 [Candidatus Staskawiczbacteria bacterium]|nr:hypothetical protein [Candidatus Staskawiczbacteria bacterium]